MNTLGPIPKYLRSVKRVSDHVVHGLFQWIFRPGRKQSAKLVLLVRTDGIGDFVYCVRYLETIRRRYEGHKLILCCNSATAEIARSVDLIDEVVEFNALQCRRNYVYRLALLRRIRSFAPAVVIYLSYHRENIGDEITLYSGATETYAFSGNDECIHPSQRQRNNREYRHIAVSPDHVPESRKYSVMMQLLGCSMPDDSRVTSFEHYCRIPAEKERVVVSFTVGAEPYIVLGAGGSGAIRRWPAPSFAVLADRLGNETGARIVLCGNHNEHAILSEIARAMSRPAHVLSNLGLMEAAVLIRDAKAFVGNESGLLHLAASMNIPSIGILGGGHFNRYFPYASVRVANHRMDCYECNWSCRFQEPYCLTDISVDDVMNEYRKLPLK